MIKARDILIFVFVMILLGLIGFLYFFPQRPLINPFEVKAESDPVPVRELAIIDSLLTAGDSIVVRHKEDSVKNSAREIAYKREIKSLKKKQDEMRPEIQPALDSLPKLAEFVGVQADIIQVQAQENDSLRVESDKKSNDFNVLKKNDDEKFKASIEVNEYYKGLAEERKKDNRKLRRQNTGLKIGLVTLGVLEVLTALKK